MKTPVLQFYFKIVLLLASTIQFSGCLSHNVYTADDISRHMHQKVVLLHGKATTPIDDKVVTAGQELVSARLLAIPTFTQVSNENEFVPIFDQNPALRQDKNIYLSTLLLSGISDKDISRRLQKTLKQEQLFVTQYDELPCLDCDAGKGVLIKFQLLDLRDNSLIWKGRAMYEFDQDELKDELKLAAYQEKVLDLTTDIMDDFEDEFIVPWNRFRFENLNLRYGVN